MKKKFFQEEMLPILFFQINYSFFLKKERNKNPTEEGFPTSLKLVALIAPLHKT